LRTREDGRPKAAGRENEITDDRASFKPAWRDRGGGMANMKARLQSSWTLPAIAALLVIVTANAVAQPPPRTVTEQCNEDDFFPARSYEFTLVDGVPQGAGRAHDASGRLIFTQELVNGRLEGDRVMYYPSGRKFGRTHFVGGAAEGADTTWFDNGSTAALTTFAGGRLHGKQTMYFKNGAKFVEYTAVNGLAEGERRHYFPDGRVFAITQWKADRMVSQDVRIQPAQRDVDAIADRERGFSPVLKDNWKTTTATGPTSAADTPGPWQKSGNLAPVSYVSYTVPLRAAQAMRFHVQASAANDGCLMGTPPAYELRLTAADGQALGSATNNTYRMEGFCRLSYRAQFDMNITVTVVNHSECLTHYLLMVTPEDK
jgi:hypothetical protein